MAAATTGSADRVRIGIVGLGAVAQAVHLPLLSRRPDLFALEAVVDLSPATVRRVGARYGIARRYGSLAPPLADGDVDAVAILTSGSHGAAVAAAVAAGIPVFCEKPLAYTLAEVDVLAEARGRVAVGYMKLYDPAVIHARSLLVGRPPVRSVEVTVLHPSSPAQLAHANLAAPPADVSDEILATLASEAQQLEARALGAALPERCAASTSTSSSEASSTSSRSFGRWSATPSRSSTSMSGPTAASRRRWRSTAVSRTRRGSRSGGISSRSTPSIARRCASTTSAEP